MAVISGQVKITSGGTAQRLTAASTPARWVIISAPPGNTGNIAFGGPTTIAAYGSTASGVQLAKGTNAPRIDAVGDLNDIWVDAVTSNDLATYTAGT
jgi:hypothetical protein